MYYLAMGGEAYIGVCTYGGSALPPTDGTAQTQANPSQIFTVSPASQIIIDFWSFFTVRIVIRSVSVYHPTVKLSSGHREGTGQH